MLDGSVTVDHRLLTESGRAEIIQEQKNLPENFRQSAENIVQQLPEGEYRDKMLKSLDNIQAKFYALPKDLQNEVGGIGSNVAKELIKQGATPLDVEVLFDQYSFWDSASEVNKINNQLVALEAQGVSLEQIFKTPVTIDVEPNVLAEGTKSEIIVKDQTTLGMIILEKTASWK